MPSRISFHLYQKTSIKGLETINKENEIIDGYHRLKIAEEIGMKEVPVEVKDVSREEAEALAYLINYHRRHLSFEQKKEIYEKLRKNEITPKEAARKLGVTERRTQQIRKEGMKDEYKQGNTLGGVSGTQRNISLCPILDLRVKIPKSEYKNIVTRVESGETQEQIAADYKTTRRHIGRILKKYKREKEVEKQKQEISNLDPPKDKYNVIVIDPPWPYGTQYDPETRRVASPYPEMSIDEIKNINIPAADDCILWLWTTNAFMHEAYHVLEAWGFDPKTILTWVKDRIGIGTWLRGQTEHCIMAIKGKPKVNLTNQSTVIYGKLREHSRKPDEFYQMVDSLCSGRKLDYFSREKRKGWDQFGDEIDRFSNE